MNIKKLGLLGMLASFSIISESQNCPSPNVDEVEKYVLEYAGEIKSEYSKFLNDTIYEFHFDVDNLNDNPNYSNQELGMYSHISRTATINSHGEYVSLEKERCPKDYKKSTNAFVKGVMIHEISHNYFSDLVTKLTKEGANVREEYLPQNGFSIYESTYGSDFVEEGVCEYIANKMGEIVVLENSYKPKNLEDLLKNKDTYEMKYVYSAKFLEKFLDSYGIMQGIRILVTNPSPTDEEIVNPGDFFKRLKDTRPMHLKIKNNF